MATAKKIEDSGKFHFKVIYPDGDIEYWLLTFDEMLTEKKRLHDLLFHNAYDIDDEEIVVLFQVGKAVMKVINNMEGGKNG